MDCAIARGLMIDDKLWDDTIKDAMTEKRSLSERIRWFALFIANVLPKKPQDLLEKYFTDLTAWPGLVTKDDKMERLLKRIEIILRIHGIQPNDGAYIKIIFIRTFYICSSCNFVRNGRTSCPKKFPHVK